MVIAHMEKYKEIANDCRKTVLRLIYKAQTSHIGSNFSCTDIMTVLFEKIDLEKDKFVLSAGWKAATLYYFLWRKGRITLEELDSYCLDGSKWIGLAEPIHKDIMIAGGSVGMGIAGGVGLAMAKKYKEEDGTVYVLESDGGMQPGMTWESAMIASQHKLNNLVVICDNNRLQAMGETKDILNIEPIKKKMEAFGWEAKEIDGHNFKEVEKSLVYRNKNKPLFINAKTIKGKGVSWMQEDNLWHYWHLNKETYEKALGELR